MSKELDEMREMAARLIRNKDDWESLPLPLCAIYYKRADDLLSLETDTCRIAVVKKNPELPENPYPLDYKELPDEFRERATGEDVYLMAYNGFERCKRKMFADNFVQEVKK